MPESKYKKEKILKRFRCFSIEIAIFWTIILIYTLINNISKVVSKISRPTKGRLLCYSIFGGNFG